MRLMYDAFFSFERVLYLSSKVLGSLCQYSLKNILLYNAKSSLIWLNLKVKNVKSNTKMLS